MLAQAAEMPPRNPYLADSSYSMAHGNPAQQDAVLQAGPTGPSRTLLPEQIDYRHVGPGHFGATTSGLYADGRRVLWGNGIDRIVKIDHDSFEVLREFHFPGAEVYAAEEAEAAIAALDANNDGFFALARGFRQMLKYRDLANLYTVLDRDHNYYIGSRDGTITAYGDADPRDSRSAIVKLREMRLPPEVTGSVMGLNMTYDGWLLVVTEHGHVVTVKRDFSATRTLRLQHSEGAEAKATGPTGRGWIRQRPRPWTPMAASTSSPRNTCTKWCGTASSCPANPRDGAWTSPYRNGWGHGSGATPSLMGFGEEDRFVVITDGEPRMNLVLYWRDRIPEDWPGVPDYDRRVAGVQPVTMGRRIACRNSVRTVRGGGRLRRLGGQQRTAQRALVFAGAGARPVGGIAGQQSPPSALWRAEVRLAAPPRGLRSRVGERGGQFAELRALGQPSLQLGLLHRCKGWPIHIGGAGLEHGRLQLPLRHRWPKVQRDVRRHSFGRKRKGSLRHPLGACAPAPFGDSAERRRQIDGLVRTLGEKQLG